MALDPKLYRRKHGEIVETLKTKGDEIIALIGDGSEASEMVKMMLSDPYSNNHTLLRGLVAILAVVLVENG